MSQYSAVLDIGSSKVISLICSPGNRDGMVVNGAGIKEYSGYKRATIVDEQQFLDAITDCVTMAENEAKHRVRDIAVGVGAPFVKLIKGHGSVKPKAKNKRLSYSDIDELLNASMDFPQPEGFEPIHSTPIEFAVDGVIRPDVPVGIALDEASATVSHMYVDSHVKRLVAEGLDRLGLEADMFIAVPLSESTFVIPEEERAHRAVLIDVGAAHTDVSLIHNAALIDFRVIDVGGAHFTGDLCYGLGIERSIAENIKRRYVYSLDYQDSIDTIRKPGGGAMRVDHSAIQYIIEERTKELASLIAAAIMDMGAELGENLPVYMTGGGITLMRGGCEFIERRICAPIQVRMPWMPRLSSPNYASAFSVMDFVMHSGEERDTIGRVFQDNQGGILKKLRDFFLK